MITDEEKIRIKALLLEKGLDSEFVFTNRLVVLFPVGNYRRESVEAWKWSDHTLNAKDRMQNWYSLEIEGSLENTIKTMIESTDFIH